MFRRKRKQILAAYGVEIVWTDPADGTDGAICKAREMAPRIIEIGIGTLTNIQTTITGVRTIEPWRMKSGSRPKAHVTHFVAWPGNQRDVCGDHPSFERIESTHPMYFAGAGFSHSTVWKA